MSNARGGEKTVRTATIRIGLLWGLAFGFLEIAYFSQVNEAFPVGFSHFIAALLMGVIYGGGLMALSFVVSLIAKRLGQSESVLPLLAGPWLLLLILALSHHRYRLDFLNRGMIKNFASLAILIIFLLALFVAQKLFARRVKGAATLMLGGAIALSIFGIFRLATAGPISVELPPAGSDPVDEAGGVWENDLRVLLVGLDGGPWKMIDPLVKKGSMPHLAQIASQGITADLGNIIPTYSPPIWTSIATGKSPDKHGIHDHLQTVLPLGLPTVPYQLRALRTLTIPARKALRLSDRIFDYKNVYLLSGHVRARRLWEILEGYGLSTVVVDWYITYPVNSEGGLHVSDHFHLHRERTETLPGLIRPVELTDRFNSMIITPDELPDGKIDALLDVDDLDPAGRKALEKILPDWYTMVRGGMARDLTHQAIFAAALDETPDWRFAAVYFRAMDNMHHASWEYNDLPGDDLNANPERRFRHAVERYYRHCDQLLSNLADYVDSNTVVIVTSDHGWENARVGHIYAPDGFFVMAGGPVPHALERKRIHIFDITPTVLALLGFPTGEDMDGSPATHLFSDKFRQSNPIRTVPTYEREERDGAAPDLQMDDKTINELRALGYIN